MNTPTSFIDSIVKSVEYDLERNSKSLSKTIVPKIIGFSLDHWGDCDHIDEDLFNRIISKIPREKFDSFENKIVLELERYLDNPGKTKLNIITKQIFNRVCHDIEKEVVSRVSEKIKDEIAEKIEEQLKEKYNAWYVANMFT